MFVPLVFIFRYDSCVAVPYHIWEMTHSDPFWVIFLFSPFGTCMAVLWVSMALPLVPPPPQWWWWWWHVTVLPLMPPLPQWWYDACHSACHHDDVACPCVTTTPHNITAPPLVPLSPHAMLPPSYHHAMQCPCTTTCATIQWCNATVPSSCHRHYHMTQCHSAALVPPPPPQWHDIMVHHHHHCNAMSRCHCHTTSTIIIVMITSFRPYNICPTRGLNSQPHYDTDHYWSLHSLS